MFEDALDLWEEAVKNAPTVVKEQEPVVSPLPNFMGLFPRAVACLQFGSENLKKVLKIIECYLILDPSGIMEVTSLTTSPYISVMQVIFLQLLQN